MTTRKFSADDYRRAREEGIFGEGCALVFTTATQIAERVMTPGVIASAARRYMWECTNPPRELNSDEIEAAVVRDLLAPPNADRSGEETGK